MNVVRVPAVFTIIWRRNFHKKVHPDFSLFRVGGGFFSILEGVLGNR